MMMKTAKISFVLVVGTLLFCSITVLAAPNSFGPRECCFEFFTKRLRQSNIVDFKLTDAMCSEKGLILRMKSGVQFCIDPSTPWAERLLGVSNSFLTPSNVTNSD